MHQGDTSKRMMGTGGYQPGGDPDPTLPQRIVVVSLIFAGGGMGTAWGEEMLHCFLMTTLVLSKTGGEIGPSGTFLLPECFFLHV